MQATTQAFVKLAQSNMDLLSNFSTSTEGSAQASANANANQIYQQATESAMRLMQSGAFAHVIQGMLKNYTEFLTELSQSSLALFSQGQVAMAQQMQNASHEIEEATELRGRRARARS